MNIIPFPVSTFEQKFNCTPTEYYESILAEIRIKGGFTTNLSALPCEIEAMVRRDAAKGILKMKFGNVPGTTTLSSGDSA